MRIWRDDVVCVHNFRIFLAHTKNVYTHHSYTRVVYEATWNSRHSPIKVLHKTKYIILWRCMEWVHVAGVYRALTLKGLYTMGFTKRRKYQNEIFYERKCLCITTLIKLSLHVYEMTFLRFFFRRHSSVVIHIIIYKFWHRLVFLLYYIIDYLI